MHPIIVDKPSTLDAASVRTSLSRMVTLCLDSDPSLIPTSCKEPDAILEEGEDARDPDDFRFWSEAQAVRISKSIEQAFDVDLTPEVIIAEANLGVLTNRILVAHELFSD
jgi:phosphatidylethanolamine N-methyltransferase